METMIAMGAGVIATIVAFAYIGLIAAYIIWRKKQIEKLRDEEEEKNKKQ